ncbi:hypothetical protein WG909_08445 [Peptostreptococcaceae bacterium AGR-M142]
MRISTSMQSTRLTDVYSSKYFKMMTRNIEEEEKLKESEKTTNEINKDAKVTDEKKVETSKDDTKKTESKTNDKNNVKLSKEDEQMKIFKEFMKYHNNQRFSSEMNLSDIRTQNMKSMMLRANMATSLLNYI